MTIPNQPLPHGNNDEIDLFELVGDLWQQKWLIIGFTAAITLLAFTYATVATPVYQATASVMPPSTADISLINRGRDIVKIEDLDVEEAYSIFTRNLTSQATRRWFYEEHFRPYLRDQNISGTRDSLVQRMSETLVVRVPDSRNNPENYTIQINLSDPDLAAEFVNRYVEEVSERSLVDLEKNTKAQLTNKRRALEKHIDLLRKSASAQRYDRVARLKEALAIAEAVGLEKPQLTGGRTQVSVGASASEGDPRQVSESSSLFLNGTKAISSELSLLEARNNDDPFINELRGLQQQILMLNLVDTRPESVRLFTLDSAADVPEDEIQPRKALIMVVGTVLGGVLGIVIAFLRAAIRRRTLIKKAQYK